MIGHSVNMVRQAVSHLPIDALWTPLASLFLTEDWFPQYRHSYATPHASYFYYSLQRREGSEDQNNMTSFRQTNPKCLLQLSTNWTFEPVTPHAYVHQVHL